MKKVAKPVFFIILLLIIGLGILTVTGVRTQYGDITTTVIKSLSDIRWGIDIRGGVDVTFSPPVGVDATDEEMAAAESVINTRLVTLKITDSEVYTDYDNDRIIVRFPWRADEQDFDPAEAIAELGSTALLTFREEALRGADGAPIGITAENVILEGSDVVAATPQYYDDGSGAQYVIELQLTDEGAEKFSTATATVSAKEYPGNIISIWMDDTMISSPVVESQITGGTAQISGNFTAEAAVALADKINGGALPFELVAEDFNTISPTLGDGARDAMVLAGAIAFALVAVFIIVMYRVPGFVAVIALAGQVILMLNSVTGFLGTIESFTLTLPGIAGIILSIGFGVDANIITAERIKEEINGGKTIDGAIESGFKRAFSAILDGNITVIMVAIILMGAFGPPGSLASRIMSPLFFMFGPSTAGAIYSFGYTLMVGVLLNLFMGVFVSRLLLKSLSRFKAFRAPGLYGGRRGN